jgi:hypothetical protein
MNDEELKALLAAMEERLMRRIDEVVLRLDELGSDIRDLSVEVARLAQSEPKP